MIFIIFCFMFSSVDRRSDELLGLLGGRGLWWEGLVLLRCISLIAMEMSRGVSCFNKNNKSALYFILCFVPQSPSGWLFKQTLRTETCYVVTGNNKTKNQTHQIRTTSCDLKSGPDVCVFLTLYPGQCILQTLHGFDLVTFEPGETELLEERHKEFRSDLSSSLSLQINITETHKLHVSTQRQKEVHVERLLNEQEGPNNAE